MCVSVDILVVQKTYYTAGTCKAAFRYAVFYAPVVVLLGQNTCHTPCICEAFLLKTLLHSPAGLLEHTGHSFSTCTCSYFYQTAVRIICRTLHVGVKVKYQLNGWIRWRGPKNVHSTTVYFLRCHAKQYQVGEKINPAFYSSLLTEKQKNKLVTQVFSEQKKEILHVYAGGTICTSFCHSLRS